MRIQTVDILPVLVTKTYNSLNKQNVAECYEVALISERDVYVTLSLAVAHVFRNVNKMNCTSIKEYCVFTAFSKISLSVVCHPHTDH